MIKRLKERFEKNMNRHPDIAWDQVEARLRENPEVLEKLRKMEETGGQPDVIGTDENGKFIFCDCSPETPAGRRSLCYDDEALRKRTKNPPASSAMHQANEMGIELLDEELYKRLQQLGQFDLKTSSWIATPEEFRKLGGALFAERRYGRVFFFHNGADSYYSVRGWRGFVCL
ncbi:MAG: DUF4256 domain-containing protein [Erysipelotrichaceae bacterium]|nr:DUF4256 domain-containing protein [Erysipelotrichaceae bacterium]MBQ1757458.1 DUF4256 domain-containing protein [Erysipelotrichaceae bacterium]MBQ3385137.1 DUF4256 domain-containing protein [Erysipelotrichaceae bacterium]